jgi:hypothetical protein
MADGVIAATVVEHGSTVLTRNVKDFYYLQSLDGSRLIPVQHFTFGPELAGTGVTG